MTAIRCPKCKRLLFKTKEEIAEGEIIKIEIQCPKCGYTYEVKPKKK